MPAQRAYLIRSASPNWNRLRALLEHVPDITIVGDTASAAAARLEAPALQPDLILCAIDVEGASAVPLLAALRAQLPDALIVLVTGRYDAGELRQLGALRIAGYFLWDDLDHPAFAGAIEAVRSGRFTAGSRTVADAFLATLLAPHDRIADLLSLTERERAVLRQLAAGRTRAEIAAAEYLSHSTVDRTITGLFSRLSVKSSRALIAEAARFGLLP